MCAGHGEDCDGDTGFFNPATKCCTYFPDLPNFLVGRAIANDNPGAAALRSIIDNDADERGGATLRTVQPNAKFATIYSHHRQEGFGHDPEMLCPYAIESNGPSGPLCGIWKQRNSVCSTWFCKHERGLTGVRFWQALQGFLTRMEWALSWWAIAQVLDDPGAAVSAGPPDIDIRVKISLRHDAWRLWKGSRTSFYEACSDAVETLSAEEAVVLAGMDGHMARLAMQKRFDALVSDEIPDRLRSSTYHVLKADGQRVTVQSRSCVEPFEAPAALLPLLHHFDGRSTAETLESIRQETRVRLDPKLVRRLHDFGILETPSSDGAATS